ncbi:hypothetical protein Tco_0789939 [Tanacetum coccineum]
MAKRYEMTARKPRSRVDSSSIQVADADDDGLVKHKKKSSKGNKVLQPKPSRNTKSFVRRISKEVVKPIGASVKSNVGKRKRLVEDKEVEDERDSDVDGSDGENDSDKEDKGSEDADVSNESEEEVKDVKTKVVKGMKKVVLLKSKKRNEEVEADLEGNESEEADESEDDNESEEVEEIEEDKESEVAEEVVKDVKTKVVKGKKKVVLSKSKKRNKEVEADVEGNESEADESEDDNESKNSEESEEDKESEVAEEVVKDVKTKVVKGKGTKGNNKGVVSKAKKRKYVSDSSEEQKVSKPKKVYKKKKQVSDSSSLYEDEKPLKIKKKLSKKKKKKPLTAEQIKKIEYLDEIPSMRSRTVPSSLFAAIRDSQVDMESFLSDIGFSSLHNVFIESLPQRFARFVVRAFSASSYEFKLEKGIIRVTPEKVHKILGVPLGGTSIFDLPEISLDDPFVKE